MNIGSLDRKIVIENPTDTQNSMGEYVSSWTTFLTAAANVTRFGGGERIEAGKTTAKNRVRFKIRFYDGITEDMRIQYNGATYYITEIQELHREGLWLTCEKDL